MTFLEHCIKTIKHFKTSYSFVHKWLDEFHGSPKYKTKHRRVRHHKEGIEEVRKVWGDEAAKAATMHILDDLQTGESPDADMTWIPTDETDYVKRGYW